MDSTRSGKEAQKQQQKQPTTEDRQKWEIIFKALKQLLRKQQNQIETLLQTRNFLHQRLDLQLDTWNSDVKLLQDRISLLQRQNEVSKMVNLVEVKKGELLVGSQKRRAFVYKHKFEHTRSELDDFKACFDVLSHKCPDYEAVSLDWLYEVLKAEGYKNRSSEKAGEQDYQMLEHELAELKREYEKLSLNKSSEVSALQSEIKFVWNHYNEMEGKYTKQLQTKNLEVEEANEKVSKLLERLDQVQLSNSEKDQIVVTLRSNIDRLEAEMCQKEEKISRFSKKLGMLESNSNGGLPTLNRCSGEPSSSSCKRGRNSTNGKCADLENESSSAQLEATVATLRAQIDMLEDEASHKNGEISTLKKELNLMRSKTVGNTPVLGRCMRDPSSSRLKGEGNGSNSGILTPKEEAPSENGCRRSKRKQENVINVDTSMLFSSQFKIPRLKSQSPCGR